MKQAFKTIYTDAEFRQLIRDEVRAVLNDEQGQVAAMEPEGFISIDQAAEFLKMEKSTIYTKTSKGEIPFTKSGKRVLFKKSDLTRWISERK